MLNIIDFGAVQDKLSTAAIQAAFDAASEARGTVLIPAGAWLTGTINMKGASLYIEKGGVLKGSGDIADYPELDYIHNEMGAVRSLLYSFGGDGITISGDGIIDMNGDAFYDTEVFGLPESRVALTDEQVRECTYIVTQRPNQPMFFKDCTHFTVRDLRIINAPSWTMSFVECRDIRVLDLTIDNSLNVPNCDGMHFASSTDIMVRGCNISAGDDCVAFTAVTDWDKPVERAVVSDCVFRSCSKAISIGYMHSIVRDIVVSNCVVYESNRALVIMSNPGTGLVENVIVSNLRLDTRVRAGYWWGNGEPVCVMGTTHDNTAYSKQPPAKRFDKCVRNIKFSNLICSAENVFAIIGENGSVDGVTVGGIDFALKPSANLPIKGRMVDLSPGEQTAVLPDDDVPYWLFVKECKNVRIDKAAVALYDGEKPQARIENADVAMEGVLV